MDILTKPLRDLTLGELAVILSRSDRPEDLAARLAREANIERAQRIYEAALERAHRAQRGAASEDEPSEKVATCTVIVQPVHPKQEIIALCELRNKLNELRRTSSESFLDLSHQETIPDGLLFVDRHYFARSSRQCQQLFSNGLLYDRHEATYKNKSVTHLYLRYVAERMAMVLAFARKYFPLMSYEEELACVVTIDDLEDYAVAPLQVQAGNHDIGSMSDHKWGLLPSHRFEAVLEAGALQDAEKFRGFCASLIERVCWGLGAPPAPEEVRDTLTRAGLAAPSQ